MRKEKDRTRYSTSLSECDIKRIDELALQTGLKKTRIIDKALKLAFNLYSEDRLSFCESTGSCKVERRGYSTSLNKDDICEINEISRVTGLSKSRIFDKALFLAFEIYSKDKVHFFEV